MLCYWHDDARGGRMFDFDFFSLLLALAGAAIAIALLAKMLLDSDKMQLHCRDV